jgi:hypothetical protein
MTGLILGDIGYGIITPWGFGLPLKSTHMPANQQALSDSPLIKTT